MKNHTVKVDRSQTSAAITLPEVFNISAALLDRHIDEGRGDKVAVRWRSRDLTYGELHDGAVRTGRLLQTLGVAPGDRVMLFVKDSPAFYFGFLGAARVGAVVVPVNTFLRRADYAYMLTDSQAKVVLASDGTIEEVETALAQPGVDVHHRIATDSQREGWLFLPDLLAATKGRCDIEPTSPHSPCFWLYSSGSTGAPKASVHEHKDMVYTSEHFAIGITGLTDADVIFSAPKLFFAYGLGNSLSFPLYAGATAILLEDRPTGENTIEMINRFQPTIYYGVPTLYAAQLAAIDRGCQLTPGPLRFCHSGGEPLPPALMERWRAATGLDIYDGIGSSEALHIYASNLPEALRPGSAGRVVPGYELRILDLDGHNVPDGEPGELWVRGGSLANFYWNKPEKTASSWRDGWFRSGDTLYRDAEGYYFFCGRGDDMLKVGGIWVSPFEIESALVEHAYVQEAAVVGVPDENELVKPKAFCVLRDPKQASPELAAELIAYAKSRLAPYKYPRWIEFIDELPKTASGKIRRFKLRSPQDES